MAIQALRTEAGRNPPGAFEYQGAARLPNTPHPQVLDVMVRINHLSERQHGMHIVSSGGYGRDSRCCEYDGQDDLGRSGHDFSSQPR